MDNHEAIFIRQLESRATSMSKAKISTPPVSRRALLGCGAAATLSAAGYRRVLGANDRVGLGFIGFGLIGKRHVLDFQGFPDVDLVAVAEVHKGRLDEAASLMGAKARKFGDFRRLLDDRDVDAVVVSTPDHWHALMTMMACAAGKDVYVEKPLSLFVREGRWMVDVARRHRRVVQVGTQQRSGPHYLKARELIQGGHIGKVVAVRMWHYRNILPGFGKPADGDAPPELDYDQWLGPAPLRKYNPNRSLYHFRWFWDYSGGQMTNLGQHSLDVVHWFLEATAPRAVTSSGGRFTLRDNGETPDVQDARFDYADWFADWSHRECSRGADPLAGAGILRHAREPDHLAAGIRGHARPRDRTGGCHPPVRRPAAGRRARTHGRSDLRSPPGPRRSRTIPAATSTSSAAMPATSSIASDLARSRLRDWRRPTAWPPPAIWRTSRSGSTASCGGMPSVSRSSATPRPRRCSSGRTGRPGTARRGPCWRSDMVPRTNRRAMLSTCVQAVPAVAALPVRPGR